MLSWRNSGGFMSKPFTTIAAIVFFVVAAVHLYRIFAGLSVAIGSLAVPMWGSWLGAAVAALLGIMLLSESRR
jgi:hypothetical protein